MGLNQVNLQNRRPLLSFLTGLGPHASFRFPQRKNGFLTCAWAPTVFLKGPVGLDHIDFYVPTVPCFLIDIIPLSIIITILTSLCSAAGPKLFYELAPYGCGCAKIF